MSRFMALDAADVSDMETTTTTAPTNPNNATTTDETPSAPVNLNSYIDDAAYIAHKIANAFLITRYATIVGWYDDRSTCPPSYLQTNLGFLLEGIGTHQTMIAVLIPLYESIAEYEGDVKAATEAGDKEGVEVASENLGDIRAMVVRKEAELEEFRRKYPEYLC